MWGAFSSACLLNGSKAHRSCPLSIARPVWALWELFLGLCGEGIPKTPTGDGHRICDDLIVFRRRCSELPSLEGILTPFSKIAWQYVLSYHDQ